MTTPTSQPPMPTKRAHTYRLPDETDATIKHIAKEDDVSEAAVIVHAVKRFSEERQRAHEQTPRKSGDPFKPLPEEDETQAFMKRVSQNAGGQDSSLSKARENAPNYLKNRKQ